MTCNYILHKLQVMDYVIYDSNQEILAVWIKFNTNQEPFVLEDLRGIDLWWP